MWGIKFHEQDTLDVGMEFPESDENTTCPKAAAFALPLHHF